MDLTPTVPGRVSVVMPAFQLVDSIGPNLDRTVAALASIADLEVVVVDDGSTDGTGDTASKAAARHDGATVVSYRPNRGKGGALQAGFAASTGETIVFLDADLDLPPEQVPAFISEFEELGVDGLVGAKQRAMAPETYPVLRRVLSRIFSGTIRLMFRLPVDETQTGLKVFRRKPLDDFLQNLEVQRYTFDLELLVRMHRAGYAIAEAPVQLAEGASASGVSLRTLWEMARDTLRIWIQTTLRRD
ncbi:MAG: glycosyltransferase family 2 protein [Actinomycetota bacterium]